MYILYIISLGTPPICTSDVNEQFSLIQYFSSQHKLVIYSICNKGISMLENFDCNRVKYVRLEKRTTTMHRVRFCCSLTMICRSLWGCLNGSYLVGRSVVCTKHKTQFYVSNQKTLVLYFVVTRTTSVLPCGVSVCIYGHPTCQNHMGVDLVFKKDDNQIEKEVYILCHWRNSFFTNGTRREATYHVDLFYLLCLC